MSSTAEPHERGLSFERVEIGSWRTLAQCRGRSDIFFPPQAERPQAHESREYIAAALCSNCAVHTECCGFARHNREHGYWGGESEGERVKAGFALASPVGISRIRDETHRRGQTEMAKDTASGEAMHNTLVGLVPGATDRQPPTPDHRRFRCRVPASCAPVRLRSVAGTHPRSASQHGGCD
jgi:hypothetical protein